MSEPYPTYQELANALHWIAVGGNHAAFLIGHDHPLHTATDDEAREHYGDDLDKYNAWICWAIIMRATRTVYDKCAPEVRDLAWKTFDQRRRDAALQRAKEGA